MPTSSTYNFVKVYLAPTDSKQYQAKTTTTGRSYFFCPIPLSESHLSIGDEEHLIVDQHLSIYSECQDNEPGLESFHLTVRTRRQTETFIIHCYFEQNGYVRGVTIKQNDSLIELSDIDKKRLQNYALKSTNILATVNEAHSKERNALLSSIHTKQEKAENLSKNLVDNLKPYIETISELITLLEKYNFISNQSLEGKKNILECMLDKCKAQLVSRKKPKNKNPSQAIKMKETTVREDSKTDVAENKSLTTETLETINQKLTELANSNKLADLQKKKELLEKKLKLIPAKDLEQSIITFQKILKLTDEIPEKMLRRALKGDIDAAHTLVASQYFVPIGFYFALIAMEQEEIFDIFFKACPMARLLRSARSKVSEDDNYSSKLSLLEIAYRNKNEKLFEKLLRLYHCDPNEIDFTGRPLMNLIASNGDVKYAQMLFDAGAKINEKTEQPKLVATIYFPKTEQTKSEKKEFKKLADKQIFQEQSQLKIRAVTPLMEAARNSQHEMVRWLLKNGADINIRGELGLDAIGIHCAVQDKPLHTPTLLALVEAGASIDSKNTMTSGPSVGQCTPLHYACQWLKEESVRTLVQEFAANPNVIINKTAMIGNQIQLMEFNCLGVLINKLTNQQTQKAATNILFFILQQDISPLSHDSLTSSLELLKSTAFNIPLLELATLNSSAETAISENRYDDHYYLSQKVISCFESELRQAILQNILKFELIKEAEKKFIIEKNYKLALSAYQTILRGDFKTEQYNERIYSVYYQVLLKLEDHENARKAQEQYLAILNKKSKQVLNPQYLAELNKKIEKVSKMLGIKQENSSAESKSSNAKATMSFAEELKKQNTKTQVDRSVAAKDEDKTVKMQKP